MARIDVMRSVPDRPIVVAMASRISETSINCGNAYELSEWWKMVLDYVDVEGDPNEAGDEECIILDRSGSHRLLFSEVDELQQPVGRIHFDLAPIDRRRDEEIKRVLALGATEVADRRHPDGSGWMVLADPAGNQFCIVQSDAERSDADQTRDLARQRGESGDGVP